MYGSLAGLNIKFKTLCKPHAHNIMLYEVLPFSCEMLISQPFYMYTYYLGIT